MGAVREQAPTFCRSYLAVALSVPRARHDVVEFAMAAGAAAEQVESVRLAVSEAVTNAVRHAYGDPEQEGEVHVTAALADGELWVLIADDGLGLEAPTLSAGLGMGLAVIASVSDYLAVVNRAGGGTELHMRFALGQANDSGTGTGLGQRRGSVTCAGVAA